MLVTDYTYDANGNRIRLTTPAGTLNARYDAQDRLIQYGDTTYTYNAAGDLTGKTTPQGTTQYNYDALGNLRSLTLPNGTRIAYLIDGQNRRVGKKVNSTLVKGFLYKDGLNPIAVTDGQGHITTRFVYGVKPNVPAYMMKGGIAYRIISDYQGSVERVVNATTGALVQDLDYTAFGKVVKDTHNETDSWDTQDPAG